MCVSPTCTRVSRRVSTSTHSHEEREREREREREKSSQSVSTYLLESQSYVPCFICHEQSQSCHLIRSCSGERKERAKSERISLSLSLFLILLIFNELALFPLLAALSQSALLVERQVPSATRTTTATAPLSVAPLKCHVIAAL